VQVSSKHRAVEFYHNRQKPAQYIRIPTENVVYEEVVNEDDVYDNDAGSTDTQKVNSKKMKARATTKRRTDDDDDDDDVLLTPVTQIEHQFMIGRKYYFGLCACAIGLQNFFI
jgi:hypothetical protein